MRFKFWDLACMSRVANKSGTWNLGPHMNRSYEWALKIENSNKMKTKKGPYTSQWDWIMCSRWWHHSSTHDWHGLCDCLRRKNFFTWHPLTFTSQIQFKDMKWQYVWVTIAERWCMYVELEAPTIESCVNCWDQTMLVSWWKGKYDNVSVMSLNSSQSLISHARRTVPNQSLAFLARYVRMGGPS